MNRERQLKLKHLLAMVAACGLLFGLARWSLVAAMAVIGPFAGYALDRCCKGPGISGAMLGGGLAVGLALGYLEPYDDGADGMAVAALGGVPGGLFAGLLAFMLLAKFEPKLVAWYRRRQETTP